MKRFAKIILCLTVVFCLVFAAQTVAFAAAEKNELKTVSYISIDENGVKVDGILRSEQDLMELGISFNATQKTVTVMRDISCTAPVGIYCDLEGLLIKTSGKHTLNAYGCYTLGGKAQNYGIYVNKTAVFDTNCELDISARDLDAEVAKATALDGKDITVFESYGVYANAPVTFRNTNEMTVKSGNVGDSSAVAAKSCAIAGNGQKAVVGKVKFVAGNVTVKNPEDGISKAAEGEIIGAENATLKDGAIYSNQKVYTVTSGPWFAVSIAEFAVIIAAAVCIVILIKKSANKTPKNKK